MEIKRSGAPSSQEGPPEHSTRARRIDRCSRRARQVGRQVRATDKRGGAPSKRAMLLGLAALPLAARASRLGAGAGATPAVVSSAKSPGAFAGSGPFPAQAMAADSAKGRRDPRPCVSVLRRRARRSCLARRDAGRGGVNGFRTNIELKSGEVLEGGVVWLHHRVTP